MARVSRKHRRTAPARNHATVGIVTIMLSVGIALVTLWSAVETLESGYNPHWPFLIPWVTALLLAYRYRSTPLLHAVLWTLFAWCWLILIPDQLAGRPWAPGERVALLQIYVFGGIIVYILGRGMAWYRNWSMFAAPAVTVGTTWAVLALIVLSFPDMQRFAPISDAMLSLSNAWIGATLAVLVIVAGLMAWRYHDTKISQLPLYRQGAFVWLAVTGALALSNLWTKGQCAGWFIAGYNLLALAGVFWLIMTGVDRSERRIVNFGYAFLAVVVATRYADIVGPRVGRVTFLTGAVLLLLCGAYFLERARRHTLAQLRKKHTAPA